MQKLPVEPALGVQWNIDEDVFEYKVRPKGKPSTRRGVLSTVSSIYDPLGFLAPFLLKGKLILQELCRRSETWDDPLPDDLLTRWLKWQNDLCHIEKVQIGRCYKDKNADQIDRIELHHFSDASTHGYAQCSYVRFIDINGKVHCSFVYGKARVTPMKVVTIPRLELSAAVLSVNVSRLLKKELEMEFDEEYFWTDNKVVLGYINNDVRRFRVVANRIQQIKEY